MSPGLDELIISSGYLYISDTDTRTHTDRHRHTDRFRQTDPDKDTGIFDSTSPRSVNLKNEFYEK